MKKIIPVLILQFALVAVAVLIAIKVSYGRGMVAGLSKSMTINIHATPTLEEFAHTQTEPFLKINLLTVAAAHLCDADGELADIMMRFSQKKMLDLTGGKGL